MNACRCQSCGEVDTEHDDGKPVSVTGYWTCPDCIAIDRFSALMTLGLNRASWRDDDDRIGVKWKNTP